jgi:uncharacterized protein YuzE
MRHRYLEVTFRNGRLFAAYMSLPRPAGCHSARTESVAPGILIDYAADGSIIGIEITTPSAVTIDSINTVLTRVGQPAVTADEFAPLRAA